MQNCIHTELRTIRLHVGFSIREMAAVLNLKPPTYQKYEDGTRTLPDDVLESARDTKRNIDDFMAGMPARIDARIDAEFPNGIVSKGGWDD
jgi:transcriptional regulator with XRE-family HTH domain